MTKKEIALSNHYAAMKIVAGLPLGREGALATLDYARDLVIRAHQDAAGSQSPSDRTEGA